MRDFEGRADARSRHCTDRPSDVELGRRSLDSDPDGVRHPSTTAQVARPVAGGVKIGPDPLGRLRVDGHGLLLRSLADDTEHIEPAVPVQIADCQLCDLGPPQASLKFHPDNGPVPETGDGVPVWGIEKSPGVCLRESRRGGLPTADRRPLDASESGAVGGPVRDEVLGPAGQRRQATTDCRGLRNLDLPRVGFPRLDGSTAYAPELVNRTNTESSA